MLVQCVKHTIQGCMENEKNVLDTDFSAQLCKNVVVCLKYVSPLIEFLVPSLTQRNTTLAVLLATILSKLRYQIEPIGVETDIVVRSGCYYLSCL